jgi:NADPH2:quinone reductase
MTVTKAIVMHATGGPEVFKWEDADVGDPGAGQVRLRQTAVGLNFIDTHFRDGSYPIESLPAIIGFEAAGVVEALGEGVSEVGAGDRVAYSAVMGSYAQVRLIDAAMLVPIPDAISDEQAAAGLLKGMTAQYLLRQVTRIKAGDTVVVHAAAGGVGTFACQWAKHLGATVIGTVSSEEKAAYAAAHGCDHPVVTATGDFTETVTEVTGGKGAQAIYESIGRETFLKSFSVLAPRGTLALFGHASGPVADEDYAKMPLDRYYIRTTLQAYIDTREDLLATAQDFFDVVSSGAVKIEIGQTFALADVGQAHAALQGRKTTGSTILIP